MGACCGDLCGYLGRLRFGSEIVLTECGRICQVIAWVCVGEQAWIFFAFCGMIVEES